MALISALPFIWVTLASRTFSSLPLHMHSWNIRVHAMASTDRSLQLTTNCLRLERCLAFRGHEKWCSY